MSHPDAVLGRHRVALRRVLQLLDGGVALDQRRGLRPLCSLRALLLVLCGASGGP